MMSRKFVDQDQVDYGKDNGGNSTRHSEFISFFVHYKSGHFEQLTIALKMIQEVFDR